MREKTTPPGNSYLGVLLCLIVAAFGSACTDEVGGETPPDSGLYFPMNMAQSNNRFVYVLNSNFDQRYNSGWLSVVDLGAPGGGSLLSREDGGQIRVLSLGGDLAVDDPSNPTKLVMSHRGSGTLSLFDVSINEAGDQPSVSCGDPEATDGLTDSEVLTDCDKSHLFRMTSAATLAGSNLKPENVRDPYALRFYEADGQSKLAVGFVSLEYLFLLDVEDGTSEEWFKSASGYNLGAGTSAGVDSIVSLPGSNDYLVGTASQRSYVYTISLNADVDEKEGQYQRFSIGTAAAGSDLVDLVFSNTAENGRTFAYVAVNNPGSVALLEITMVTRQLLEPDGSYKRIESPEVRLLNVLPLDGRPSGLTLLANAGTDRLFVTNFETDEVVVVGRQGESLGVERILGQEQGIGRGPYSALAVDCSSWGEPGCQRLVVANFFGHSLSVLDISSADAADFSELSVVKND